MTRLVTPYDIYIIIHSWNCECEVCAGSMHAKGDEFVVWCLDVVEGWMYIRYLEVLQVLSTRAYFLDS